MEEVNALKVRKHLGEILDRLSESQEPILVSKGKKIRAVLVTPEQFERRFLDWQVQQEKNRLFDTLKELKRHRKENVSSLKILRQLRGYPS